jgi:hypothetical protein
MGGEAAGTRDWHQPPRNAGRLLTHCSSMCLRAVFARLVECTEARLKSWEANDVRVNNEMTSVVNGFLIENSDIGVDPLPSKRNLGDV